MAKKPKEHRPLSGVHDETIYYVLTGDQSTKSWWDKCNELEASLVRAGWTPPAGHPLSSAEQSSDAVPGMNT